MRADRRIVHGSDEATARQGTTRVAKTDDVQAAVAVPTIDAGSLRNDAFPAADGAWVDGLERDRVHVLDQGLVARQAVGAVPPVERAEIELGEDVAVDVALVLDRGRIAEGRDGAPEVQAAYGASVAAARLVARKVVLLPE